MCGELGSPRAMAGSVGTGAAEVDEAAVPRSDGDAAGESLQALQCPITREIMADPVVAGDGYTYERQSIQRHWANQLEGRLATVEGATCGANRTGRAVRTSPITGEELDGGLRVNRLVLDLIRAAIQEDRLARDAREDWERRREEVEQQQRSGVQEADVQAAPCAEPAAAPSFAPLASAPPYERSGEHVRFIGHADAPRWGLAAKVRLAKTALACDFVEVDAWAPDFMFHHCMVPACHTPLGILGRRRHHCRRCGRLVCSGCAPHSAVNFEDLGANNDSPADLGRRICGECLEDMLDRLERRALNAAELQQVMILDARLEQWTQMQCAKHCGLVRVELTERFEQHLAQQQRSAQQQEETQRQRQVQQQRAKELNDEIARLNRIDTSVMDDARVMRHVERLSTFEAEWQQLQRDFASQGESQQHVPPAESTGGVEPAMEAPNLDPTTMALRQQWEQLVRQEVQHLNNEEALRHFEQISQLQDQIESAETQAALARSAAQQSGQSTLGILDLQEAVAFQRSRWPLPMALESPTAWPTTRMLRREDAVRRARRREALLQHQEFERKMADLAQARQLEVQRRRELEILREQEEAQRQQNERAAEQRRQRAQELDDLARRAVAQMVGPDRRARMCGRCRAGPIMNDACSNLATHNDRNDAGRRRANHCPRCNWFDRNWNNWPEWDGIYGPH